MSFRGESPWDIFPAQDPEAKTSKYVILADGESYTGVISKIESITIPKDTFSHQPEAITGIPLITFEDGREFKATAEVVKNALVELRPPIGCKLFLRRNGKPQGKPWVDWTVTVLSETGNADPWGPTPDAYREKNLKAVSDAVNSPKYDDPPPF